MLLRLPLVLLVLLLSIVGCEQQGEEINTNDEASPTNQPTTVAPDSDTDENTEAVDTKIEPGATPPSTEEEESATPNDGEGEKDGTGSDGEPSEPEAPKEETPN